MFEKVKTSVSTIVETLAEETIGQAIEETAQNIKKEVVQNIKKEQPKIFRKLGGRLDPFKIKELALLKEQQGRALPQLPQILSSVNKDGIHLPLGKFFNVKLSSRLPLNIRGGQNPGMWQYYIDFFINLINIAIKNGLTFLGTLSCFSPQLALLVIFGGLLIYVLNQFSKTQENEGQSCDNNQEQLNFRAQFVKVFGASWELFLASGQYILQNKELFTFLVFLGILGYNSKIIGNSVSNFENKDQDEMKELVITTNSEVENSLPEPTSENVESQPGINLDSEVSIVIPKNKGFKIRTSNLDSRELSLIQSSTDTVEDSSLVNQVEPREHFQMVEHDKTNPKKCWKTELSKWKGISLNKTIPFNFKGINDFESQKQKFQNDSSSKL